MKYNNLDIEKAIQRQLAWSAEAKEEGESALLRAKREKRKGLLFCAKDSLQEAKICFFFAEKRKKIAEEYKKYLKK